MFTLIYLLSFYSFVNAGSQQKGQNCSVADNRLQAGTYQFFSDCDSVTFCNQTDNTCHLKGCRKDIFPFGYPQDDEHLPDLCPNGQFCPDEADACQDLLSLGSPCQLNRDGTHITVIDTNIHLTLFRSMSTTSKCCTIERHYLSRSKCQWRGLPQRPVHVRPLHLSSLSLIPYRWANMTGGSQCVVENIPYIGYGPNNEEFIDIVSRYAYFSVTKAHSLTRLSGNCQIGYYCDAQTSKCLQNKVLGTTCDADKEYVLLVFFLTQPLNLNRCDSFNCMSSGVCGPSADTPRKLAVWVYVIVAIAILGGKLYLGPFISTYPLCRHVRYPLRSLLPAPQKPRPRARETPAILAGAGLSILLPFLLL